MAETAQETSASVGAPTVRDRVAWLRERAATDPVGAKEEAWAWFAELGERVRTDRDGAAAALAELFGRGRPSTGLGGPTDGMLVAPLVHPLFDPVARMVTAVWMPWMGKSFYDASSSGDNRLTGSARWAAKLLWPRYATRPGPDGRLAFDFQTRVERGAVHPEVDVLVIDYEPVERNPDPIIRRIRDELVEIVPRAHLGRILWRTDGRYDNIGYFALRTRAG